MFHPTLKELATRKILNCQNGFLLSAALTLLTALILLGTTAFILSSTDIKIGGNFRNSQLVLQVAMAGAERAREALRVENLASSNPGSFSDELNSSTRKGPNGVLDGYSATTDDVALASGTLNGVSYAAYLTNDTADGISNTTDSNGKVMITSVATGPNNSKAQVQTVVKMYPPPSSPAAVYSKGDVTGNGSSLSINGNDACGGGTNLAPVYTMDPATTSFNGNPTLSGNPATPQHGPLNIDIESNINALKGGATTIYANQNLNNTTYGSTSNYVTVYSNPSDPNHYSASGLTLNGVTGHGILLVDGDLTLGGGFHWNGLIFATGAITLNGGGGPNAINISGLIFSGTSTLTDITVNGGDTIGYNSCDVKKALAASPFKVVTWKQNY